MLSKCTSSLGRREMERREKSEQARRETEAILAAQAEEVRLRKLEMDKRDAERVKRMEIEAKERAAANLDKRKKADERIQSEFTLNIGKSAIGSVDLTFCVFSLLCGLLLLSEPPLPLSRPPRCSRYERGGAAEEAIRF